MWRNINQLIGKTAKTTIVTSIKSNDQIFTNKDNIAETFNDYFSKIVQNYPTGFHQVIKDLKNILSSRLVLFLNSNLFL